MTTRVCRPVTTNRLVGYSTNRLVTGFNRLVEEKKYRLYLRNTYVFQSQFPFVGLIEKI